MTLWFPYDQRKVYVRTIPVCRWEKLQGDRKECKHIGRTLEPPKMPEKPYQKS